MGSRRRFSTLFNFVFYVLYCFDVGIFLIIAPWTGIWQRNYFLFVFPPLSSVYLNPFFRGAVSGLGILLFLLGVSEVYYLKRRQ
ncbi:MAG: hypothetical protein J7L64_07555 [Acidobacteria bacterium]|nr:hypothetical protein [Acidobacteriota bacterium]